MWGLFYYYYFLIASQKCPVGSSFLKEIFMSLSLLGTHTATTASGSKKFKRAKRRQSFVFIKLLVSTEISEYQLSSQPSSILAYIIYILLAVMRARLVAEKPNHKIVPYSKSKEVRALPASPNSFRVSFFPVLKFISVNSNKSDHVFSNHTLLFIQTSHVYVILLFPNRSSPVTY